MLTYSTCRSCQRIMDIVDNQRTHPGCADIADPAADLDRAYRQALLGDDDETIGRLGPVIDRTPPPPRLADAALLYASWGWSVFPLQPGGKAPATAHGFKDATTDPDQIRAWWTSTPLANIGLPTGGMFDVIDIDAPSGWRAYFDMIDADAIPDAHGLVGTGGAGLHLYIQPSGEGNRAGMMPGIDYRGRGGYVAAPPSTTALRYTWRVQPSPAIKAVNA